jgi:hypothetical protein
MKKLLSLLLKMKKIMNRSTIAIILVVSLFVIGCQKEDSYFLPETPLYENETFLSIDNFSSKTEFSDVEQEIVKDAMIRIGKYTQINDDGRAKITKTAQELNIAEDIYEMFELFLSLSNSQEQEVSPNSVRLKSGTEGMVAGSGCDAARLFIEGCLKVLIGNNTPEEKAGSTFAIACLNRYWAGTGQSMNLTAAQFGEIKKYIPKHYSYDRNVMTPYTKNQKTYYKSVVSFYNTPYKLSLGTATVVYDENFKPVGLYDTYDFNKGNRSFIPEAMTRAVDYVSSSCGVKSYNLFYGVY